MCARDSEQVLTGGEAVVPPRVCEGGRADRCVSRVRERRSMLLGYPVTVLRLQPCWEVALERGDAAARGLDVRRDAQRAHAESPALPGGARRHHARGVHADGEEEVSCQVLGRPGSDRVLDH